MSKKTLIKNKAFSLVEILIAIGMFAVVTFSIAFFAVDANRFAVDSEKSVQATQILKEIYNAVSVNKSDLWSSIVNNTGGPKKLEFTNNRYVISTGEEIRDDITIRIFINNVQRDVNQNIVSSGGVIDPNSREIEIELEWEDPITGNASLATNFYVNNWEVPRLRETIQGDFSDGTFTNAITTGTGDGAVEMNLSPEASGDWCNPSLSVTQYDLPGQGIAKTIRAIPGRAHIGTGSNSSGYSYMNISVSDDSPPIMTLNGTFDGYKSNSVFGDDSYVYIATDNNSKEVVIYNVQQTPYLEVGHVDGSGSNDANDIYISGTRGYFLQGNQLRVFDASSPNGARTVLGSFTLADTGLHIYVKGNYAYVLLATLALKELQIINITNPAAMSETGYADVTSFITPTDLYVNDAATRIFLGHNAASGQRELFLIDITSKNGSRPAISSYETNGMSIKDLVTIPDGTKLILAGTGGEEYQVVNITNEQSLTKCGGLQVDTGVNGVAAVLFDDTGNAYTYVATNDSTHELKVILGGPGNFGGGNGQGTSYPNTAQYESNVYDTQSTATQYYTLEWTEQLFANTDLRLQVRSGDTTNLTGVNWVGPDGTASSYFTNPGQSSLPSILNNHRYFQYKVYFDSPLRINTPIFEEIILYYER